jgi:hypothetical protein
MSLHTFEAF